MLKIQNLLQDLVDIVLSLIKIIVLSKLKISLPQYRADELYVLGNGPSLKDSLNGHLEKLKASNTMVVNLFCFSDYYGIVKPSFYVLLAPEFFMTVPPTENHKLTREKLFKDLVTKTSWPIILYVPFLAEKFPEWKAIMVKNKNIQVQYFNSTPVEGPEWFTTKMFELNLGMPRPHNVLVPSIFLAINMAVKNLYILGADHSWHEEIKVDEKNEMTVNHEHFYDKNDQRGKMHKLDGKAYHIHDVFRKLHLAFKGYFILNSYAQKKGVSIFNASKRSYIDAFKRVNF